MPSPKSPLTILGELLNQQPPLKGFAKVTIGKNTIANAGAPPRIVIFPVAAGYTSAHDITSAFNDVDLKIAARLWGRDIDEAWDLRARLVAAMWGQAQGSPDNPNDSAAGYFFQFVDETWDVSPDTAQQGQELEVIFNLTLAASDKSVQYGEVDEVSTTRTATLTADMLVGDVTANVNATSGYPSTGVLYIEGEAISYSGLTATSFTGLVRGINGTTAAAHSSGATVEITPT